MTRVTVDHHPFDVVGWDGYYYPWAFNINDFEPRVGRVHLPPPIHQTFEAHNFVICSFCPRPYDFDPAAVPAPQAVGLQTFPFFHIGGLTGLYVMTAFGATAALFVGLSAYALTTQKDFSFMGGFLFAGMVVALVAGLAAFRGLAADEKAELSFIRYVAPMLQNKCLPCHGADEAKIMSGLDLRTRACLLKGGDSKQPAVVPGQPGQSPLYLSVTREHENARKRTCERR